MTWVTNKAVIVAALTNYTEIEETLEVGEHPSSRIHKGYTLRLGEPDIRVLTNKQELHSDRVILTMNYRIDKDNSLDSNYDDFKTTLFTIIKGLANYGGLDSLEFKRDENDNKRCIGTMVFFYGYNQC